MTSLTPQGTGLISSPSKTVIANRQIYIHITTISPGKRQFASSLRAKSSSTTTPNWARDLYIRASVNDLTLHTRILTLSSLWRKKNNDSPTRELNTAPDIRIFPKIRKPPKQRPPNKWMFTPCSPIRSVSAINRISALLLAWHQAV